MIAILAGIAGGALVLGCGSDGARSAVGCTTTVGPDQSEALASAIVGASDGATICLRGGTYPLIHVVGAAHGSYVTIRPAAGATASVAGIEVIDSSFLRFEALRMTEGFNMRDSPASAGSHDYQFIANTFEKPTYGIVLAGTARPIKRVLIEGNRMHDVDFRGTEKAGSCAPGYAGGQDVTIEFAEGVTIARNTFKEAGWHYIQGGSAGPEGIDVEHNLFEGRVLRPCSHLNIWQIFGGGTNDTFKDNVAIGEPGGEAATDGLLFENGPGSADCTVKMRGTLIEGNLFVDAASSYEIQIYTTSGARIAHNTVVHSQYGTALLSEHCGAGSDYTMTHNINVENYGKAPDFTFGACTGRCAFDYNVSEDGSASLRGSLHHVIDWSPAWATTRWDPHPRAEWVPPSGFYVPAGLPFPAGYEG